MIFYFYWKILEVFMDYSGLSGLRSNSDLSGLFKCDYFTETK